MRVLFPESPGSSVLTAATASGARRWNDANVLAFGLRLTSDEVAREMIDAFLDVGPDSGELATIARVESPLD
jgi:ribose 5-phosphate isomerase B